MNECESIEPCGDLMPMPPPPSQRPSILKVSFQEDANTSRRSDSRSSTGDGHTGPHKVKFCNPMCSIITYEQTTVKVTGSSCTCDIF
ncbi:unnamed protein product [Blepharisma stoltei]|uniref:Uncharacterized protein n=1 Tax=Blepharisma stoltei TaxID=1481888 RepID=A0AAU9JDZ1_9CILI|nr:unnamed protein product [Blepharisma stoltei]